MKIDEAKLKRLEEDSTEAFTALMNLATQYGIEDKDRSKLIMLITDYSYSYGENQWEQGYVAGYNRGRKNLKEAIEAIK